MPAPPERLASLQRRFADHIRDPERNPAPDGIEERRLAIYRRLFFNNLSSLFAANFPLARKIVPDKRWRRLVRAFLVEHRPTTPLFPEIGREFVRFLADHPEQTEEWPWLPELCHWQFQATCARNDEAELADQPGDPTGNLLSGCPVVNPTLRLARYRWPVDRISARRRPEEPADTALAVYRLPDDRIRRLRINPVTGRLLERMQETPGVSGLDCLRTLAEEIGHSDVEALVAHGSELLESLRHKSVLLGSRPPEAEST